MVCLVCENEANLFIKEGKKSPDLIKRLTELLTSVCSRRSGVLPVIGLQITLVSSVRQVQS